MSALRQITFSDELLAGSTVHRRFSDGREEWRRRTSDGVVSWRDNQGNSGTDEPLGRHLVKRTSQDGTVVYGKENGYGRTAWGNGVLTINRSSLGRRIGVILAAVAGSAALGELDFPPQTLSAAEEEELRATGQPVSGVYDADDFEWGSDDESVGDYGDFGDFG